MPMIIRNIIHTDSNAFLQSLAQQAELEEEEIGRRSMATQGVDTIADCVAQAQSDSPEARSAALTTLSALTKLSPHNRNLLVDAHQALPLLLSLSGSDSPLTQSLSLSILLHLSLNPNLKHPLAGAAGLVHRLNSLVLTPSASPDVARLAASLVCSLAMHDKNKAPLGVAGTVGAIVDALGSSPRGHHHHLLSSLAELVEFHGNCTLAVRAGAAPVLVRIIGGPAEDLSGAAVSVIGRMARFKEGIEAIRKADGVVGLLAEGLRRGCMVSRESAVEVLVMLFEESGEFIREAAGRDDFFSLLADLSIRGSTKLREKAALLMKKMETGLDGNVEGELPMDVSIAS